MLTGFPMEIVHPYEEYNRSRCEDVVTPLEGNRSTVRVQALDSHLSPHD